MDVFEWVWMCVSGYGKECEWVWMCVSGYGCVCMCRDV